MGISSELFMWWMNFVNFVKFFSFLFYFFSAFNNVKLVALELVLVHHKNSLMYPIKAWVFVTLILWLRLGAVYVAKWCHYEWDLEMLAAVIPFFSPKTAKSFQIADLWFPTWHLPIGYGPKTLDNFGLNEKEL